LAVRALAAVLAGRFGLAGTDFASVGAGSAGA